MIQRRVALVLFAIAAGLVIANLVALWPLGVYGTDTITYLAAGERLNAGHGLYSLVPGDRLVELKPPLWTVPLVSPPAIAVLWRPLAALPGDIGAYLGWTAALAALVATIAPLLRRQPLLTSVALFVLATPTAFQIAAGNINSMVLLGVVLVWRAWAEQRDMTSGSTSGLMAAVKLTPAVTAWWLLVTGRRRAVAHAVLAAIAIWLISLAGAGVQAHLDYLAMLRDPASLGIYPDSLAGIAASWGVPEGTARLIPWAAAVVGLAAVWLLRGRPSWSFTAAVLTMVFGSPALTATWFTLLFAVLAPIAYPARTGGSQPRDVSSAAEGPATGPRSRP